MKLWGNKWNINASVEAFETRDDLIVDQMLVTYDVLGSLAHAHMLNKKLILSQSEYRKVKKGLSEIYKLAKQGKFQLMFGDEDVHTKIENYLTKKCGIAGKKIHTGRSRNDQVLTALRILTKDKLLLIEEELLTLACLFTEFAQQYEFMPMPGYTHMQKAMPSSVGMWSAQFAESFLDDFHMIQATYNLNDQSPLGSAAGYGVPIELDRKLTAQLLDFEKIQNNNLYCQNSRGKIEALIVSALAAVLGGINRFANDVLIFTTDEFAFFSVSPELCTGSSLMPQKKNIDVAELLRSKVKKVLGNYVTIATISFDLLSGYNRDLQDIKKPFIESLETTHECLRIAKLLLMNLTPNETQLTQAISSKMFATHDALSRVGKGVPFREAYVEVSKNLERVESKNTARVLRQMQNDGSTGNLGLQKLKKKLQQEIRIVNRRRRTTDARWNQLLK